MQFLRSVLSTTSGSSTDHDHDADAPEHPPFLLDLRATYPTPELWQAYVSASFGRINAQERRLKSEADHTDGEGDALRPDASPSHAYSSSDAFAGLNARHNRYTDICPYNRTRVHLSPDAAAATAEPLMRATDTPSDYINASWVSFPGRWWIASQAPLPWTFARFWHMIAEHDTTLIVNLTPVQEGGRLKAHPYWPGPDDPPILHLGGLEIAFLSSAPLPGALKDVEVISLSLKRSLPSLPPSPQQARTRLAADHLHDPLTTEERTITLLWYKTWPDHGVPSAPPNALLALLDEIDRLSPPAPLATAPEAILAPPIVLHCSAGCGRTGTLAVLDAIRRLVRAPPDLLPADGEMSFPDPVLALVERARAARPQMVQKASQLQFIYDTLIYSCNSPISSPISSLPSDTLSPSLV